ncbi:hypothetical protein [Pseudomonas sp. Irchel 3A7]|uniref:hypothetical protein n=1 Tax=Pseudomonas sp. Irchel 3A7 TaxID=2008913 RepID=UPI001481F93B|nr:hypothetical protein [Pseudomonas sp. Irchel 3A7]
MLTVIRYLLVPVLALLFVVLLPVGFVLSLVVDPLQLKRKKTPHSYFKLASAAKRQTL